MRLTRPDTNRFADTAGAWWANAAREAFTKQAEAHIPRMRKAGWSRMTVESQGDASRRIHSKKAAYHEQEEA